MQISWEQDRRLEGLERTSIPVLTPAFGPVHCGRDVKRHCRREENGRSGFLRVLCGAGHVSVGHASRKSKANVK